MAKKFNKDNIERIIALALEINGYEKKRTAGNGIAVFASLNPHVSCLDIGIHLNGWDDEENARTDERYHVPTTPSAVWKDNAKKVINRLEELLEQQRKFDKENAGC